jgi:preprotein translocase subunit SecE
MSAPRRSATKRGSTGSGVAAGPPPARPAREPRATATNGRPAADRGKPTPAPPSAMANRTAGIRRLINDTLAEMRKINWPDSETTRNLTVVVIGISVVLGAALGGIDFVLLKLFEAVP